MFKNSIFLIIGGVVISFSLLYGIYLRTNQPSNKFQPEATQIRTQDHWKWSAKKKIILMEYSDLQCPACQYFYNEIKALEKDKNFSNVLKEITFIFRHFPLTTIHPNAFIAAQAAEAAGQQGKFYEMVDLLYIKQAEWSKDKKPEQLFLNYARELKLDSKKFQSDLQSAAVKARVEEDIASGERLKISATPTFFLQGKQVKVNSFAEFRKLLQEAVK